MVSAPSGDATTTLYLAASAHSLYPLGVLTSIVDTFINGGTTTEYMTQHLGSQVNEVYAKIQTTSSREYYRISPTATLDYNDNAVRPTGLVASSTSLNVNGPTSTFYTVEEYRTYVDGHYAHLVSSISNVVTDPAHIKPTPIYNPAGAPTRGADSDVEALKKSLYSSYDFDIKPSRANVQLPTRTVGLRNYPEEIENEIEADIYGDSKYPHSGTSLKRPRQIDLDAVESDTFEVKVAPEKVHVESRPTYTVGQNGQLTFPTPSIEAVRPEVSRQTSEAHRFAAPRATKTKLDSVTYVGFVDFTTTIDDTVVIFKPKQTFSTQTRNLLRPVIEPTRTVGIISASSRHPSFGQAPELDSSSKTSFEDEIAKENAIDDERKHTSGIDALKSLLSSSRKNKFGLGRTTAGFGSSSRRSSVRPSLARPSGILSSSVAPELSPSIDPTSDVEVVFKTLYTTFTYFTTFFRDTTTRTKSREEVTSEVLTITNLLKLNDLPSISNSCAQDSSCVFKSANTLDEIREFTDGHIGRPSSKIVEAPRSGNGRKIGGDEAIKPTSLDEDTNAVLKTFFTTYTYFSTLFVDGTTSVSTHTEVYSNVQTASVALSQINSDSISILPTSTAATEAASSVEPAPSFPVRRLEISSVRPVQLHSELTTPGQTEEDKPSTDRSFRRFGTTVREENEEGTTVYSTTLDDEGVFIVTQETPALTTDLAEEVTSAAITTESNVNAESVTEFEPKTLYTTFTYYTTLFQNNSTFVTSNFKTVTNVMTEPFVEPSSVESFVTIFTTFTYWTTEFNTGSDGSVRETVTSKEETLTDILPASITSQLSDFVVDKTEAPELTTVTPANEAEDVVIVSTIAPSISETANVFTFYTTRYDGEETIVETIYSTSGPVSTAVPEIQSGEAEVDIISVSTIATPSSASTISPTNTFQDIDNDLTLSSDEDDDDDEEEEVEEGVKPSRTRGRVSFSRPGNTFTPVIRPLQGRKPTRPFRPSNLRVATTVATRTRQSVKPTLIATPASSAPQATPAFGSSSRSGFLASSSLFNRGSSRFSSGSASFGSASISPSSVSSALPSQSLTSSLATTEAPSVVISPLKFRRPNPFKARLRERQQERLKKLRDSRINKNIKSQEAAKSQDGISIPNFPVIPGGNAPIFVSSQRQKISPNRRPKLEVSLDSIKVDETTAAKRQRARERIKALFERKRPLFGRPKLVSSDSEQSRRKRQVSTNFYGAEFGTRTRARQSYVSGRSYPPQPTSYLSSYPNQNKPFTAFAGQTQQQLVDYYYEDDDSYSSSSSVRSPSSTSRHHPTFRRQAPSDVPDQTSSNSRSRSRASSRFEHTTPSSRTRTRTRFRDPIRHRTTTRTTTTTSSPSRFANRFRPRTVSNPRTPNNRNNLFSRDNSRQRFGSSTSTRNNLFTRGKVVDYDDYDYYDYEDTNLQSSKNGVPDFITVTHQVPIATKIPVIEFGRTELRDILSSSPSLEVVAVTALKSTDINDSPVIYANAHTLTPQAGIQDILFDALRATETTSITFTPTRIRGRRTSFSHILPTTIYNVETVSTRVVEPVDQNQLLNSLLQQLLLGGGNSNALKSNPLLPAPGPVVRTPVTQEVTHTSTYVTTITTEESTIIPITFRGKEVTTTLVESSTKVITATEFSTETVVKNVPVAPTPSAPLPPIAQTAAPLANPQIAELLPALLGAQQANILTQQQQQQEVARLKQQQEIKDLLLQQQQDALLAQQFQEEFEQFQLEESLSEVQQEFLNEQLLAKLNLDDFTDEELANLDIDAVVDAVTNSQSSNPLIFPKKNLFGTSPINAPKIEADSPKSSVITIFKSGSTPGDFTRVFSTVYFDDKKRRRRETYENDIHPSLPVFVTRTEALSGPSTASDLDSGRYILGGARGPVSADIWDLSDLVIQSGIVLETETQPADHVIPTMSLDASQHP